jgi:aspartate kinase
MSDSTSSPSQSPSADPSSGISPRPVVVQKYGGSSVATPERLRQVAARVAATARSGAQVVVVVSAMGKTTDELLALARSVLSEGSGRGLGPPRRELDMLLSCGERISMALLAMALHDLGVAAISFTGSQSGILTNDRHSGARIIEVRPIRIQDELARGQVVIVAGFQGMSYKREITTLGRGGSDTTAVALAAALGAQSCEIYSDVDGVYSADPRVVPEAAHLDYLGYPEMQELASQGAKVLNAQAVDWAERAGIVIYARKSGPLGSGNSDERETRIGPPRASASERRATAVTGLERLVGIASDAYGEALVAVLEQEGVALHQLTLTAPPSVGAPDPKRPGSGSRLEAAFVRDDLPDFPRTLAALRASAPDLQVDEAHGTVTAVGPSLGSNPALLREVATALQSAGLHPRRYHTSPLRLTIALPTPEIRPATVLLHTLLCAGRR